MCVPLRRWAVAKCALSGLLGVFLGACTPVLDWREVRVDDAALTAWFPCKPDRRVRDLHFGGVAVRMEMVACTADASTYAVSFLALQDAAAVTPMLEALRSAAITNIGGDPPRVGPFELSGMTPNRAAGRLGLSGRMPGGAAVREQAAFFARGLRIYQASVIGAAPTAEAVEMFISSLEFRR